MLSTEAAVSRKAELPARTQPTRVRHELNPPWSLSPQLTVAVLTVVGFGIRCFIVRGFWLDEATSGYDSRLSYAGMLRELKHDNHPPLEYTILWGVAHTIGSTPTDLRLPSILFGTLLIPMLYLAGRALYHERAGVLAAAFGTVGAIAVWYAQEARMYALFMLLATITIWAQTQALRTDRRRYWWAWAAAGAAAIWTQWFAALMVGTEILIIFWALAGRYRQSRHRNDAAGAGFAWRRPMLHLALAVTGIVVVCAPGLPLLLTQFRNNQANGLGFGGHAGSSPGSSTNTSPFGILNNLVWALFGYHSDSVIAVAVAIWPLGILFALLILGRGRSQANIRLLTLIVLPMAMVFVAGAEAAQGRSLFEIRYFIEAVPAMYLLLAGMTWTMTPSARSRRIVTAALLFGLAAGLVLQQTDSQNPRLYGYQAAFSQISSVAHPGDEILYAPSYFNVDVAYFEPHMAAAPVTNTVPSLPAAAQIFVVGTFNFIGVEQSDAATSTLVRRLESTRHLERVFSAPNVTVWEFS